MLDTGQPAQTDPAATQGGMTICIHVGADGSLSVSQEPAEQAADGQPVGNIGEALKLALQIYQQSNAGDEASQVQAGFQQAGGSAGFGGMTTDKMPKRTM